MPTSKKASTNRRPKKSHAVQKRGGSSTDLSEHSGHEGPDEHETAEISEADLPGGLDETQIHAQRWPSMACGAAAAIGVAWAAAYVSLRRVDRDVGIAAWVAVAVVGASATISAANGPPRIFPRLALKLKRIEERAQRRLAMQNARS